MKKHVLFVHSAGPQGEHEGSYDFVTTLRQGLGDQYEVHYPIMPHPEDPDYESWKQQLGKELATLDGEIILVGHSLGGAVLLKYFAEEPHNATVAGMFLVATPFWGGDDDWQAEAYTLPSDVAQRLPSVPMHFYHSSDDDIVPVAHLGLYAQALPQATMHELDGYGHVYRNGLPELIHDIKNL